MPVPNSFANVTTSIPLSQLDANFNTPITLGNTAIQLGNTVTTLNNMTLANVTISSGSVTLTNASVTTANVTTANIATAIITTANVATANVTTSQILNYGTANGVAYLNASKVLTTGTALVFDGTNLSLATGKVTTSATGTNAGYQWGGTTVTSRLYDDGSGNVYLDIGAGASNATVPLIIRTKGGVVTWNNGTSPTMTLDASGNLGINTTSPGSLLSIGSSAIYGGGTANESLVNITGAAPSNDTTRGQITLADTRAYNASPLFITTFAGKYNATGNYTFMSGIGGGKENANNGDYAGYLALYSRPNNGNLTERARITSGGTLLVGTTAYLYTGASLFEVGGNAGGTIAAITNTNTTAGNGCLGLWQQATSGNNVLMYFNTDTAGTLRGSIDYNRGAGLIRYNTTSDATLKNIIGDSDGQKSVEILNTTRIREYAWKDDEQQKPQIGVIAQELYETFKGAVSVGGEVEKTDEEGNVTTEYKPWGVDKTAFTFHLIAGWQAHEKMIQELKAEIAALKGNA